MYDLGELPQRPTYTVTMTCFDDQTVSWSIGRLYDPGTLTYHDVRSCDGTPRTVDVSLGMPTPPLHLFVIVHDTGGVGKSSQAGRWRIQVSSNDRKPGFAPPALSAGAPSADAAHTARTYLQCLHVDGSGAPCPETYQTQDGAIIPEIPRGDDLHLALPADWTIEQIAVDAVPSSLICDDPSPAGVRPDDLDRHATRLRRACRARRRPGARRLGRCAFAVTATGGAIRSAAGTTSRSASGADGDHRRRSAVGRGTLWYNPRSVGL